MPLIHCEVIILLPRSEKCIIVTEDYGNQEPKFAVLVVTLSAQEKDELLQQLKTTTDFKRTIN